MFLLGSTVCPLCDEKVGIAVRIEDPSLDVIAIGDRLMEDWLFVHNYRQHREEVEEVSGEVGTHPTALYDQVIARLKEAGAVL